MAKRAENEGFRMLEDFVCAAIYDSAAPKADERHQGWNEGVRVVEEILLEISGEESSQRDPEGSKSESPAPTINLNPSMQRLAEELAALIATQSDPVGVMALFQQKVFAQVNTIQNGVKVSLNQKGVGQN